MDMTAGDAHGRICEGINQDDGAYQLSMVAPDIPPSIESPGRMEKRITLTFNQGTYTARSSTRLNLDGRVLSLYCTAIWLCACLSVTLIRR